MIAKSDLVILAISGTLLATSIYRWQSSLSPTPRSPAVATSPAPQTNVNRPVAADTPLTSDSLGSTSASGTDRQTNVPVAAPTANAAGVDDSTTSATSANTSSNDAAEAASADTDTGLYGTYIVQPGDNLTYIADLHGTSVDALRTINDIQGSLIYVDQELLYPLPAN